MVSGIGAVIATSIPDFTATTALAAYQVMPFPLSPGLRSVEFCAVDNVASVPQPFTQETQIQSWPGGDWWEGTLTLPKMPRSTAAQWLAFLMAARGMAGAFMVGDPFSALPQGTPTGTPVVNSNSGSFDADDLISQPMTTALQTSGWVPDSVGNLLPGDYIQTGVRLHVVLNTVNADSIGAATIQVWPSIRELPQNDSPLITSNAQGLFRLAVNKRTWNVDETRLYGLSFKIMEAK